MSEEHKYDIHDAQDWIRSAELQEVQNFLWWAEGVIDVRVSQQNRRKKRSDAGKTRKIDANFFTNTRESETT